jgi:ATP-binding cassette, subfamily B, bacterial
VTRVATPRALIERVRQAHVEASRLIPRFGRKLAFLGCAAIAGGIADAVTLVVLAQIGVALTVGSDAASLDLWFLSRDYSVASLAWVGVAAVALRLAISAASARVSTRMSTAMLVGLRTRLLRRYLDASWEVQTQEPEGHFGQFVGAHAMRAAAAILQLAWSAGLAGSLVALLASALVVNPVASAAIVLGGACLSFALRPFARISRRASREQADATLAFSRSTHELVRVALDVRTFGVESEVENRIGELSRRVAVPYKRVQFLSRLLPGVYQAAALVLVFASLVALSAVETSEVPTLGAVVLMLVRGLNQTQQLQVSLHQLNDYVPYLEQLRAHELRYEHGGINRDGRPVPEISELRFENVTFEYPDGRKGLREASFTFARGQAVAIVGPSGSGKSTLARILLRLAEPTDGAFIIDGVEAKELSTSEWFRRVSYVPQEPQLVDDTVRANIRFFRPEVSDADIERAAAMAGIDQEILAWPQGYDTPVGPRGLGTSGGQRQRIALARALANRPDVLVLDEPTSALDSRSEDLINETLRHIKGTVTLVIISHRGSALEVCDDALVLEDGKVAAFESVTALRRSSATVQRLLATDPPPRHERAG